MLISGFENVVQRIARINSELKDFSGKEFNYSVKLPNGEVHTYFFKNLKQFEKIEDEVSNCFIWAWSLKDYLKEYLKSSGQNQQMVEVFVEQNQDLKICADIANTLKHSKLTNSRSGPSVFG